MNTDMNTRTASEGKWFTQSSLEEEQNRIFVKQVVGFGDLDTLFTEWTEDEKSAWEKQHPQEIPEPNIENT